MGIDSANTSINLSKQYYLDGTEVYGVDGQTIVDIREIAIEHVKNLLKGEEW